MFLSHSQRSQAAWREEVNCDRRAATESPSKTGWRSTSASARETRSRSSADQRQKGTRTEWITSLQFGTGCASTSRKGKFRPLISEFIRPSTSLRIGPLESVRHVRSRSPFSSGAHHGKRGYRNRFAGFATGDTSSIRKAAGCEERTRS
jgi:hypothetical protein